MPSSYEQIKSQLSTLKIVSHYINLVPKNNNYWGICPFHSDSSPSLSVNETKNIWKCFSCNVGGDGIKFLMMHMNWNFTQAFQQACELSNIAKSQVQQYLSKNPNWHLYELNAFVGEHFHKCLNDPRNITALNYLVQTRKLSAEQINKFQLGYCPSSFGDNFLVNFISQVNQTGHTNYQASDLVTLGLVQVNDHGQYYDYFLNRIIFPIYDQFQRLVGFSGRVFSSKHHQSAKYLNSSESVIFHKRNLLYHYSYLKQHKKSLEVVYLVEGFFDVIAYDQLNISALGTMGTNVSSTQIKLIRELFDQQMPKVVLAFDADVPGQNANEKIAQQLLKNGVEVLVQTYPESIKDIDELVSVYHQNATNHLTPPLNYFQWLLTLKHVQAKLHNFDQIQLWVNEQLSYFVKQQQFNHQLGTAYFLSSLDFIYSAFDHLEQPTLKAIALKQKQSYINLVTQTHQVHAKTSPAPTDPEAFSSVVEWSETAVHDQVLGELPVPSAQQARKKQVHESFFTRKIYQTCGYLVYFLIYQPQIVLAWKKLAQLPHYLDYHFHHQEINFLNLLLKKLYLISTNQLLTDVQTLTAFSTQLPTWQQQPNWPLNEQENQFLINLFDHHYLSAPQLRVELAANTDQSHLMYVTCWHQLHLMMLLNEKKWLRAQSTPTLSAMSEIQNYLLVWNDFFAKVQKRPNPLKWKLAP